jgi:cysteinyl-tRNA synthetase
MPLVIYNSLTKRKELFEPLFPLEIRMYTCGVTVYDDCHVGHARSLFIFDCFKRFMEYSGYQVKLVRNITDVDDKIINRAKQEGVSFEEIQNRYIKNYSRDLKDLEIDQADFEPRATENVHFMVGHIRMLIEKGHAYEVDGDVYFSVRSFPTYGQLSGQGLDEMLTAVRIEKDEKKKDPLDFALWKKSKEGEPAWESPWGRGRPGWHIECSTMSMRYLRSETLDIHAGGRDLIFPHHENEIAQSEALTGQKFARYWMHHGLLTIDGHKMSKSLGNFVTIQDALKKYPANILKLFFLGAHYGSSMDFSFSALEKTKKGFEKIEEFFNKVEILKSKTVLSVSQEESWKQDVHLKEEEFQAALNDDFNTAQGLAVLFELLNMGNKFLADPSGLKAALHVKDVLVELGAVLGLRLKSSNSVRDVDAQRIKILDSNSPGLEESEVTRLIAERKEARACKDFKKADEIRDYLKKNGIVLEDTEKNLPR